MHTGKFWVKDYETLTDTIVIVLLDLYSEDKKIFIWNTLRDDRIAYIQYLNQCVALNHWHMTFNGNAFDSQITEYILRNQQHLLSISVEEAARAIYDVAQRVIDLSNRREFLPYRTSEFAIQTVDVFKLNHWDSPTKHAGLKWIEFTMDWPSLEENPFKHTDSITNWSDLKELVKYCINDVRATRAILLHKNSEGKYVTKEQVNVRYEFSKRYNLDLYSASEPTLSKELFLHFLAERMKMRKWDLKKMQTFRSEVSIAGIISPKVNFKTSEFQAVQDWFKSLIIPVSVLDEDFDKDTGKTKKKGPHYTCVINGVQSDFGLGGIHGCVTPGVYVPGNDELIMSADVTSFYPMLAIVNEWHPAHLPGKDFLELYRWIFDERQKYAKGTATNYVMKILLNATYGLSKNRYSFLYDPEFTFKITINGQLLLAMLYERLLHGVPGAKALMQNTDGLEFVIPKSSLPQYEKICKRWEKHTGLELEYARYSKMVIRDVNNYISVDDKGKVKAKGAFEYKDLALHKNKSYQIIPKALHAYFLDGIAPADYLASNRNIFDYCAGHKLRGEWYFNEINTRDGDITYTQHKKLIRYFISNRGSKFLKCNPDGRQNQLDSGPWMQTVYNTHYDKKWDEYDVNDKYYLEQIQKEIDGILHPKPAKGGGKRGGKRTPENQLELKVF